MIIGLSGRKRSGKSTLGAALEKEFGFKQLAFASGVREFIAAAFGWPIEWLMDEASEFKSVEVLRGAPGRWQLPGRVSVGYGSLTGRELLQHIGTDAARKIFGEDCWVNVGMKKAADGVTRVCEKCGLGRSHRLHDHGAVEYDDDYFPPHTFIFIKTAPNYVFTDVRFPNEVKAIQNAGGKVIRLNTVESVTTLHDYVAQYNDNCPETGECQYQGQEPDGNLRDCELPAAAHPCPFPVDRHVSECSLPDVGDYNLTLTGPLDVNTTAAVNAVKGWLAK